MSIVALKRKTSAARGISGGKQGFSINGTTRLQGFVGQGVIARHLVHTPFGGNVPRDQNGQGNEHIVEPSELCCLNDKDVAKSSVLSGAAALRNRVDKVQMNVKPGLDSMLLSQSLYLDRLKRKNLKKIASECPEPDPADIPLPPVCPVDRELFTRTYRRAAACRYPITKTVEQEDQQSRLDRLAEACSAFDPQQPVVAVRRAPVVNR